jgi:hypothetical protein
MATATERVHRTTELQVDNQKRIRLFHIITIANVAENSRQKGASGVVYKYRMGLPRQKHRDRKPKIKETSPRTPGSRCRGNMQDEE